VRPKVWSISIYEDFMEIGDVERSLGLLQKKYQGSSALTMR
jgi:hypothetical protein